MKCNWVKCGEVLSNRVSTVVRRFMDHIKFAACMVFSFYHIISYSFGSIYYHCICVRVYIYIYIYIYIWLYVLYASV